MRNLEGLGRIYCKVRCVMRLVVWIEVLLHFAVEEGLRDVWFLRV